MLPGPIIARELRTAARQPRSYSTRALIATGLLTVLGANHYGWWYWTEGRFTLADITMFAQSSFITLIVLQGIVTIVLVPNLVAGAITEEKERKTLPFVLGTELSSSEIVLGKLGARLLQFAVWIAAGLPVLFLLTLLGGVDPVWVMLAEGGTLSLSYFLATLSLLLSTLARGTRPAIRATLVLAAAWLVGPIVVFILAFARVLPASMAGLTTFVNDWILASSPFAVPFSARTLRAIGPSAVFEAVGWMASLQLAYGTAFLVLAVCLLRPVFRAQEGAAGQPRRASRAWWRRARPPCGDDPMLWKERHPPRPGRVARFFGFLAALAVVGGIGYGALRVALPLLYFQCAHLLSSDIQWADTPFWLERQRRALNVFLRGAVPILFSFFALVVTSGAACGITVERQSDTWDGLLTTPLSARAILRAKMVGAVWQPRWLAVLILGLGALGLSTGALHPLGAAAALVELAALTWFATALGTWASLVARNTSQASGVAGGILLFANGLAPAVEAAIGSQSVLAWLGCMPMVAALSLFRPADLRTGRLDLVAAAGLPQGDGPTWVVAVCIVSVVAYTLGGAAFTLLARTMFDRAVGRPRRAFERASYQPEAPARQLGDDHPR
jgi:ABC-type transport system involved in multi-copper enzyme maturation permease subunit